MSSTFPRWAGDHQPEFVFQLCRQLARNHDVTVLAPAAAGAAQCEFLDGVRVLRFAYAPAPLQSLAYGGGLMANLRSAPWRLILVPGFLGSLWWTLRGLLRDEHWDVVHAHWSIPQGLVAAWVLELAQRPKPGLAITAHGSDLLGLRGRFWDRLNRYALLAAGLVTAVGPELEARARSLGVVSERLRRLPMGVDCESRFVPAPKGTRRTEGRILFVGRLAPEKGPDLAVRALAIVLRHQPNASLEIVGDGPERARLESLADRLGLSGRVTFMGALPPDRLPERYHGASVCVVPSRREGFGLVALEAFACGCAAVLADLPSLREIALDGEVAQLFPAGDSVALAAAVVALIEDRAKRSALETMSRMRAQAYSWATLGQAYDRLLDAVAVEQQRAVE